MRIILDTNVLVSALFSTRSLPAQLVNYWRQGKFALMSCDDQLDEIRRVTRHPRIRERLSPAVAGRLVNDLRDVATILVPVPDVSLCKDPWDNYLLGLIEAGQADFLVTGDKADLLVMERYAGAMIVTVREMVERLR